MTSELLIRILLIAFPIVSGGLIVWTARACASGRIKRNWAIGIRLPQTMKSDEAWLACHTRAKRALTSGGIAMIVAGIAGFVPLALPTSLTILGLGAIMMLVSVIYGAVVGVRAAKSVS